MKRVTCTLGIAFLVALLLASGAWLASPSASLEMGQLTPANAGEPSTCAVEPPRTAHRAPTDDSSPKPVQVALEVHLEEVSDRVIVEAILQNVENHNVNWRATVFVSPQFARLDPATVRSIEQRGHQIAVVGIEDNVPLNTLSVKEQERALVNAIELVRSVVQHPEDVVDWKPRNFDWNSDTLTALQKLRMRSISDIFPCGDKFVCRCPYARSQGKVTFPYPVQAGFWAIPISELEQSSRSIVLDDRRVFSTVTDAHEYLRYLLQKYEELQYKGDPMVISVHPSVMSYDKARLQALIDFLDYVAASGGKLVSISQILQENYITNFHVQGPASPVMIGSSTTLTITYKANLYCPKYRFRAYGRYNNDKWKLIASDCQFVDIGDQSLQLNFTIPKLSKPTTSTTYTVMVVGQASFGTCDQDDPGWPTLDKYEVKQKLQIRVQQRCIPLPGRQLGDPTKRLDVVFVPDRDYGPATNIDSWLPTFLSDINFQIEQRLNGKPPIAGNMDKFNFYYTREQGDAEEETCGPFGRLPRDLAKSCPFADVVVVLHKNEFRDCSSVELKPNIISAEGPMGRSFIHESGHGMFCLADEYDGNTTYFQSEPYPNIWMSESACRTDAYSAGWDPNQCIKFTDRSGGWWKLGTTPYIMFDGSFFANGWGKPASRRIRWVLDQYTHAQSPSQPLSFNTTSLNLTLSSSGFSVNGVDRKRDTPPNPLPCGFVYKAKFKSFNGEVLGEYRFGDPRYIYAEQGYPFPTFRQTANFVLNLPYYYNAQYVDIYDANDRLVHRIDVSPIASGGIRGVVTDNNGRPVANVRVEVVGPDLDNTVTAEDGRYSILGLRPGTYAMHIIPPATSNLIPATRSVTVSTGRVTPVDVSLPPGTTIRGRVADAAGRPIPNAVLYLTGFEMPRYSTDANGRYVIRGVEPGAHTLNIVSTRDYRIYVNGQFVKKGTSVDLTAVPGQSIRVDFIAPAVTYVPALVTTLEAWQRGTGIGGRAVYGLDAADSTCNTLFAATDGGLYKSNDGGRHWAPTGLNLALYYAQNDVPKQGPTFDEQASPGSPLLIPAVAVCPANSRIVYAATWGQGIYVSTDAGITWQRRDNGLTDKWIYAVAVHPQNCQVVYAGTNAGGVFKSTDGGRTWHPVNRGLTNRNVRSLALAPSHPSTLYVGTTSGVFKSIDGGNSWQATATLPAEHVRAIAVRPTNPDVVYVGLLGHGVYKSTDGGRTWHAKNRGLGQVRARALAIDPLTPSIIYVGRDDGGGVYRSTDGGNSWQAWNRGLSERNVKSLLVTGGACHTLHAGTTRGAWYFGP